MHLLIPFASCDDPACRQVLRELRLPHLQELLARLTPQAVAPGPANAPDLPHAQVQAAALGLDPQAPAWAALRAHELGLKEADSAAWAFITPCHWQVGQNNVLLLPPWELALTPEESQALLTAMQPYFAEDGIALLPDTPARWLARGEVFRPLASASVERALGRNIAPWLPASPLLRRLQNEMQMLLYTHTVNDARAQHGALTVNSFWISGSGALIAPVHDSARSLTVADGLLHAALCGDWSAWGRAWAQLDATELATLQERLEAGQRDVVLTLCGEHRARSFSLAPRSLWTRLSHLFQHRSPADIMNTL